MAIVTLECCFFCNVVRNVRDLYLSSSVRKAVILREF